MYHFKLLIAVFASAVLLSSCRTTGSGVDLPNGDSGLPGTCGLADGDEVTDVTINNVGPIELEEGESENISITVTLNRPATEAAFVCMELKDSELVRGDPMAIGFVVVSAGNASGTNSSVFGVECSDNEIRGTVNGLVALIIGDEVSLQDTTGERSTRVRAQELRGIQTLLGSRVGVAGEQSQRIRVRCS